MTFWYSMHDTLKYGVIPQPKAERTPTRWVMQVFANYGKPNLNLEKQEETFPGLQC